MKFQMAGIFNSLTNVWKSVEGANIQNAVSTLATVHYWRGKIHSMISKWFKIFPLLLERNWWCLHNPMDQQWSIIRTGLRVWLMVYLKFLTLDYNSATPWTRCAVGLSCIKCIDIRSDHSDHNMLKYNIKLKLERCSKTALPISALSTSCTLGLIYYMIHLAPNL